MHILFQQASKKMHVLFQQVSFIFLSAEGTCWGGEGGWVGAEGTCRGHAT